ncbi:MAG TPA: lipopolysaccharide heptosyltransferase II [Thermodesulfovibrionales bacterium]|nr:lipopolysaccharide heptosyltransferase II [Thermodesulfovibrionales bacterium]
MFDRSCKNVLVRGVNWIGDSVMTLPAIRSLKKALPDSRLSLLVKPWVSPVFEHNPFIDEIIPYGDEYRSFFGRLRLSRRLSKKGFCGAVLLQNAFDAALITLLSGIGNRVGYSRDGRGFLLNTKVPVPQDADRTHQIYYYLNLLKQAGIEAEYAYPYIYLLADERLQARTILGQIKRPLLGINPGATYGSAKRWFPDRFSEVASWFIKDTGGSVVVFGGQAESDISEEICRDLELEKFAEQKYPYNFLGEHLLNMTGKTTLRELIAFISECDVLVTNDSGPLHIGYGVRTPMVAIFGSTDPVLTGPPPEAEGVSHVVIKPDIPCSPCFGRVCSKNDMECMYAVTPDDVYFGIKKLLAHRTAVFFDRDGTLNKDTGYINRPSDFHVFEDIGQLRLLKEAGLMLIGVSNQSGIARGIVDENFVRQTNKIFIDKYGFDDFFYCPHHPDEHCPCRKPEPEMLLRARAIHRIDLKKSYIVGDKEADMLLARAVGAKTILVRTGMLRESSNADYSASNLSEAVEWILRNENP